MRQRIRILAIVWCFCVIVSAGAPIAQTPNASQAPVTPGELFIEPSTLINLGFEWFIEGDENRNASVEVSYRKMGSDPWKPALPLLRLKGERIYAESRVDLVSPNMFAGSILDLDPGTAYEARFIMKDADGVRGTAERIVTVRTRPEDPLD